MKYSRMMGSQIMQSKQKIAHIVCSLFEQKQVVLAIYTVAMKLSMWK